MPETFFHALRGTRQRHRLPASLQRTNTVLSAAVLLPGDRA